MSISMAWSFVLVFNLPLGIHSLVSSSPSPSLCIYLDLCGNPNPHPQGNMAHNTIDGSSLFSEDPASSELRDPIKKMLRFCGRLDRP